MTTVDQVYWEMVRYYAGDPKQIQHFVKVHSYAALIARMEDLDGDTRETLEIAALVHDIGIKPALEKYGRSDGPLQEKEGEPVATELLRRLSVAEKTVSRAAYLVGTHHTLRGIEGIDHRILLEADMLVNLFEGGADKKKAETVLPEVFRTESGIRLCREMYGLNEEK